MAKNTAVFLMELSTSGMRQLESHSKVVKSSVITKIAPCSCCLLGFRQNTAWKQEAARPHSQLSSSCFMNGNWSAQVTPHMVVGPSQQMQTSVSHTFAWQCSSKGQWGLWRMTCTWLCPSLLAQAIPANEPLPSGPSEGTVPTSPHGSEVPVYPRRSHRNVLTSRCSAEF